MLHHLRKILIPVDFSSNTSLAISKAIEFCRGTEKEVCIHLLHVQRLSPGGITQCMSNMLTGYAQHQINADYKMIRQQLEEIKATIEEKNSNIQVRYNISFGDTVLRSIIRQALSDSVDLIVIGKHSHHSIFPFLNTVIPSKITAGTGIPVLTVKPGSLEQEIKTVVIPVGPMFTESKLDMLAAFSRKASPQIKLVIFNEPGQDLGKAKQLLLSTFQLVKSKFLNIVNYEILDGTNKAGALLKYCNKIGADMLIVYAGVETRLDGWTNRHISDMLPAKSQTQVLAMRPT